MDDEKIIALFLGRDESAIRETDIKYGGYCRSISRRILNSDEDIEECVSDAYLKLWNTIPPKRPPSLKTYLGSIVRNLSINRLNSLSAEKRNKEKEVLLSELEDCIPSENAVEDAIDRMILVDALNRWLENEKPEMRKLFYARYWYGYEYSELAEYCNEKEQVLMLRLHRMRKRLRKFLKKEGIFV